MYVYTQDEVSKLTPSVWKVQSRFYSTEIKPQTDMLTGSGSHV